MNKVALIGNICQELELKVTNTGKNVCSFTLAIKRPYASDTTDFIRCTVWGKTAQLLCQYCTKGNKIGVTGAITSREFTDKDGNRRSAYEVLADDVEFLSPRKEDTVGGQVAEEYDFTAYSGKTPF